MEHEINKFELLINKTNIRQSELSEEFKKINFDISSATISKVETFKSNATNEQLSAYSKYFGISQIIY